VIGRASCALNAFGLFARAEPIVDAPLTSTNYQLQRLQE
jgi:hypothetical protein